MKRNLGHLALAIYLIVAGIAGLALPQLFFVANILAILAGILLLLGR
jgi:hypothetical protein